MSLDDTPPVNEQSSNSSSTSLDNGSPVNQQFSPPNEETNIPNNAAVENHASSSEEIAAPAERRGGEGRVKCLRASRTTKVLKLEPHTLSMFYHFRLHKRTHDEIEQEGDLSSDIVDVDAQLTSQSESKRMKLTLQSKTVQPELSFAPRLEIHAQARYSGTQMEILRKRARIQAGESNVTSRKARKQTVNQTGNQPRNSIEQSRQSRRCSTCASPDHMCNNRICPRYQQPKLTTAQKRQIIAGADVLTVAPLRENIEMNEPVAQPVTPAMPAQSIAQSNPSNQPFLLMLQPGVINNAAPEYAHNRYAAFVAQLQSMSNVPMQNIRAAPQ